MNSEIKQWKLAAALGMVACSSAPILLLSCIDYIDFNDSKWAHEDIVLPFISRTFGDHYLLGLFLPVLTAAVAVWFLAVTHANYNRIAWALLLLVLLHLFWLSYGILAFYLTNQTFIMSR